MEDTFSDLAPAMSTFFKNVQGNEDITPAARNQITGRLVTGAETIANLRDKNQQMRERSASVRLRQEAGRFALDRAKEEHARETELIGSSAAVGSQIGNIINSDLTPEQQADALDLSAFDNAEAAAKSPALRARFSAANSFIRRRVAGGIAPITSTSTQVGTAVAKLNEFFPPEEVEDMLAGQDLSNPMVAGKIIGVANQAEATKKAQDEAAEKAEKIQKAAYEKALTGLAPATDNVTGAVDPTKFRDPGARIRVVNYLREYGGEAGAAAIESNNAAEMVAALEAIQNTPARTATPLSHPPRP